MRRWFGTEQSQEKAPDPNEAGGGSEGSGEAATVTVEDLLREHEELRQKYQELRLKYQELVEVYEKLRHSHDDAQRRNSELSRGYQEVALERTELREQVEQLEAQLRDSQQPQHELEELERERDELQREREKLLAAQGKLQREHDDVVHERAVLREEAQRLEGVLGDHETLERERAELLEKVGRLEHELRRNQEHAERTSKMVLFATSYAESVRESARHDAELAMRKARARADQIIGELEAEKERAERELQRLHALTGEIRKRLSAFTAAALHVLDAELEAGQGEEPAAGLADLQDALRSELASATRPSGPAVPSEAETPES
jgi:chromosome segregation ATPase